MRLPTPPAGAPRSAAPGLSWHPARWPLRYALPLGVAVVLLVALGVAAASSWRHSEQALRARALALLGDTLDRLERHDSRSAPDRLHTLGLEIAHAHSQPLVTAVVLLDEQGRVRLAHRRAWQGEPVAGHLADWDPLRLQHALASRQSELRWSADGLRVSALKAYALAEFDPAKPRRLVPGLAYVELDLTAARADLQRAEFLGRLPEAVAALGLLLALTLWLHLAYARPLARLQHSAAAWARGDFARRAQLEGPAEIRALVEGCHAMAEQLARTEGELRASQEQLSTVLYSTGDALLATDLSQRITLMNPAAERLTGWTEAEARGRPVAEVFRIEHAHTGQAAQIPVERVLNTGEVVGLANHTVLIGRDGRRTHIADSAAPVRDAQAHVLGVVLVFRDVDEAYRLERALAESEHHYRTLANIGHALLWTSDAQGQPTWCNDPWLDFSGESREQALGTGWDSALHPDDRAEATLHWRDLVANAAAGQFAARLRRQDGQWRWMLFDAVPRPGPNGQHLGHVLLMVDITSEREADQRLQTQLEELHRWQRSMIGREDRIRELKGEVNALLARLGEAPRYVQTPGSAPPPAVRDPA